MNKILAKEWTNKLEVVLPRISPRLKIKLAWHLAALGIDSDEGFAALGNDALRPQARPSESLILLRSQYLAARETTPS